MGIFTIACKDVLKNALKNYQSVFKKASISVLDNQPVLKSGHIKNKEDSFYAIAKPACSSVQEKWDLGYVKCPVRQLFRRVEGRGSDCWFNPLLPIIY